MHLKTEAARVSLVF